MDTHYHTTGFKLESRQSYVVEIANTFNSGDFYLVFCNTISVRFLNFILKFFVVAKDFDHICSQNFMVLS